MAASKTIGGINVTISASTDKFAKAMTSARKTLSGFVKSVNNTIFSMKGLAAALAGGVVAGAMVKFTKDAMQQIDALGELSDKLGISTDKLAGLQLAAAEAGVDSGLLEKSLTRLSAATGMAGDKALRKWIEDTSKLSTQSEKLAAAVDAFGMRGTDMVRFLNGGTKALDEAYDAAVNLGLALDRKTVAGVERAMDAFGRFKFAVSGIFRSLAAEMAPFIEVLSNKATDFLASNGRGAGIGKAIADAIISMAKFVADSIATMVASVMDAMGHLVTMFNKFRQSPVAKAMGLESSRDEVLQGMLTAGGFFSSADKIRKNLPSVAIDKLVSDARAAAAASVGPAPNGVASLFGTLLGNAKSHFGPGLSNAQQLGEKLWQGMAKGIQSAPTLMQKGWLEANLFAGRNFKSGASGLDLRTVAFQDPTSREGFAQRVRSLAQNDMQKIGRQQLERQTRIEQHTKRTADAVARWNFQPAGI